MALRQRRERTVEEIVELARRAHGERYDYAETRIVLKGLGKGRSLTYRCSVHGLVEQAIGHHLNGKGCNACRSLSRFDDPAAFAAAAQAMHGDRYDYSSVVLTPRGRKRPMATYRCRIHGEVTQLADAHLKGAGCLSCSRDALRMTRDDFLRRFADWMPGVEVHAPVDWEGADTLVWYPCATHRMQPRPARAMLRAEVACTKCARMPASTRPETAIAAVTAERENREAEDFVQRATSRHGQRYSYDLISRLDDRSKVSVRCERHGLVVMTPERHLEVGCESCEKVRRREESKARTRTALDAKMNRIDSAMSRTGRRRGQGRLPFSVFVDRAREVHGDRYAYDPADYEMATAPVWISCQVHGRFSQLAANHMGGDGCPLCPKPRKGMTFEAFAAEAGMVHGGRYEYHPAPLRTLRDKVVATCRDHGDFVVEPGHHLEGFEKCPRCPRERRDIAAFRRFVENADALHPGYFYAIAEGSSVMVTCPKHGSRLALRQAVLRQGPCGKCDGRRTKFTWPAFLAKAADAHGDKYRYREGEWTGLRSQVSISCPDHGEFVQEARSHLRGHGCRRCADIVRAGKVTRTFEEFVEKASKVHGGRYAYLPGNETHAQGADRKVRILCSEHGEFEQARYAHLAGQGCPKCAGAHRRTQEEFISEATDQFEGRYGYDKVEFVDMARKILVTCRIHGDFEIEPRAHLSHGSGCRRCAADALRTTKEEFLARAAAKYGDRFDYSRVEWATMRDRVVIGCPKHGLFEQSPDRHLASMEGCHYCGGGASEIEWRWLEHIGVPWNHRQKFLTIGDVRYRVDAFDEANGVVYEFWGDLWHGGRVMRGESEDPREVRRFQETMRKREAIVGAGYELVEVWEKDFRKEEAKRHREARGKAVIIRDETTGRILGQRYERPS